PLALAAALAGGAVRIVQDQCGPFTDVSPAFCPYVLEMYYLGITAGTSPTTYSPDNPVTRGQAAVFVSKGVNQAIARSSRRAALGQWWTTTPHYDIGLGVTADASGPIVCDGADVWVGSSGGVSRVRASDGRVLETWSGTGGGPMVSAMGRIFVAIDANPGRIFMIDPSQPAGSATLVADNLGNQPTSIAFDGEKLWTGNLDGSISIVRPGPTLPWTATTLTPGFKGVLGLVFDGNNLWATDFPVGKIHKLDANGGVLATYTIGDGVQVPMFDGENIWVPNCCGVAVLRPATGLTIAYLHAPPGLLAPYRVAFDGMRTLVLGDNSDVVMLWDAATLELIQTTSLGTGTTPQGVCSDGINFWVTLGNGQLGRF
ncbi:MAG: S-layer homology domain-containing protein, partial [Thermoanaerobaculia bacterium]